MYGRSPSGCEWFIVITRVECMHLFNMWCLCNLVLPCRLGSARGLGWGCLLQSKISELYWKAVVFVRGTDSSVILLTQCLCELPVELSFPVLQVDAICMTGFSSMRWSLWAWWWLAEKNCTYGKDLASYSRSWDKLLKYSAQKWAFLNRPALFTSKAFPAVLFRYEENSLQYK